MRSKTVSVVLACLLAISIFSANHFSGSRAHASVTSPQADGPTLVIPTHVGATAPGTVTVPVQFRGNGTGVASMVFSLDYDPACLTLDTQAGQLAPGVATFNIGPQFSGSASLNTSDTDGELDIVIGDFALPISTLPDRVYFMEVTFNTVCEPAAGETIVTPLNFSVHPPPSFSNTLGYPLAGTAVNGSIAIERTQPGQTSTPTPTPSNPAPVAADDTAVTRMDETVAIDVLANDTGGNGNALIITEVTQGGFGQVTINDGSSITYEPAPGRHGEDLFTYTIADGQGGLDTATVNVMVKDENKPPVAVNDSATTVEYTSVLIDVLANDYDVDSLSENAQLSVIIVGQPGSGSTVLNQDGSILYIPDDAYVGEDTFVYVIVDEEGASAVATVVVTVEPSDEPHGSTTTEVDLADFTMETGSSGNVAKWTTRAESDLLEFQVHRTAGAQVHEGIMDLPYTGIWTRVSSPIDGQGRDGGVYSFVDETALPGLAYAYMLGALGRDNHLTLYGPQMVVTASSHRQYIIMLPYIAAQ